MNFVCRESDISKCIICQHFVGRTNRFQVGAM